MISLILRVVLGLNLTVPSIPILHSKQREDSPPQFEKRKTQRNEQKTKERTQTETAKNKFIEADVQADMKDNVFNVECNKAAVATMLFTFVAQNTSLNRCSKG